MQYFYLPTFSFSFGVFASGFLVCESKHGIGTMICTRPHKLVTNKNQY